MDDTINIATNPMSIRAEDMSETLSKLDCISEVRKEKSGVIRIYNTPMYSPSGTNGTMTSNVF
jgi:hypothetical protein